MIGTTLVAKHATTFRSMKELVERLAKQHNNHKTLTDVEKDLVIQEYPQIGERNEWIDWVLRSVQKGKCPYR